MRPHLKPCCLHWVCNNAKPNVTKKCRVKFYIASKLIDQPELDILLLDICGIVLGIPYLYDMKAFLFRHEKKYHLTKDGVEYIVKSHHMKVNSSLVSAG